MISTTYFISHQLPTYLSITIHPLSSANAGILNIDFSTEDEFITDLVNGQSVESPDEFGNLFTLNATGAGSGGLDNVTFIPTPSTTALLAMAGLAPIRRRR